MTTERKFLSVQQNSNNQDVTVFDTEAEAREHAETALQYLTKKEKEQTLVYIADVTKEDLADWAFDDDEIDWASFESCGHECYDILNDVDLK